MSTSNVVRLVDIREVPLDVAEVVAALDDLAAGGLTLFVGMVRDHDGPATAAGEGPAPDKPVISLDYSAHPTALARLREVCERIAEEHDVHGVAAVHRVGHLELGDVAVVVATTASHRGEAFTASKALIDTLKAEVPIWKHQRFADGDEEWVGLP
ncbi:molybdopterin synthase [Nocardioides sp. Soil777]|uniref:molybdenum cofactor biosynthesis protein MoaE n=1 Tax=Nocardioides sp. Soil777 TaxID=1736409 RepID=UPI000702A6D3|nr:molybdenum cofactor biosynthesis protein MoaE [Nocardioides sp. Soil777]KRF00268.1 molybdopterin synthase [Nocardioides sp. Soil777]